MGEGDEGVIRKAFARWNSGEREIDREALDPEIEIHSMLAQRSFHGYDGALEWVHEIDDQFADWQVRIDELRDAGAQRYVVEGSIHGRGRQSGVDLDQPASWLVEMSNGRILRLINFIGRDAAAQSLAEEA
jgi:ketosteroid isomerase-like protein